MASPDSVGAYQSPAPATYGEVGGARGPGGESASPRTSDVHVAGSDSTATAKDSSDSPLPSQGAHRQSAAMKEAVHPIYKRATKTGMRLLQTLGGAFQGGYKFGVLGAKRGAHKAKSDDSRCYAAEVLSNCLKGIFNGAVFGAISGYMRATEMDSNEKSRPDQRLGAGDIPV